MSTDLTSDQAKELASLRAELEEARETLEAIRSGEVDALVVRQGEANRIFTLEGADQAYRLMVEQMAEGAAMLNLRGQVTYANQSAARLLGCSLEGVVGGTLHRFLSTAEALAFRALCAHCAATGESAQAEYTVQQSGGAALPVVFAVAPVRLQGALSLNVILADQTENRTRARAAALAENEERLRLATEASHAVVFEFDPARRELISCHGLAGLIGIGPAALPVGEDWWTGRVHPEDEQGRRLAAIQALAGGAGEFTQQYRVRHQRGHWLNIQSMVRVVRDPDGRPRRLIGTMIDITERKLSEAHLEAMVQQRTQSLNEANRVLRVLAASQNALARAADERDLVLEVCRTLMVVGGYQDACLRLLEPAQDAPAGVAGSLGRCLRNGALCPGGEQCQEASHRPWQAPCPSLSVPLAIEGSLGAVLEIFAPQAAAFPEQERRMLGKVAEDLALCISALRNRQEREWNRTQLAQRAQLLRDLASELVQVEHRERQRLAKVLHDDLQQLLVAAKYRAEALVPGTGGEELVRLLALAIASSRTLASDLSPKLLVERGILPSLQVLARQLRERHDLEVTLEAGQEPEGLPLELKWFFFDTIRELLFNVVKHAGVQAARVQLSLTDLEVAMTVEDEGCGFDPGAMAWALTGGTGLGLAGLRKRVECLGGSLAIDSRPGAGTRIQLAFPREILEAGGAAPPLPAVKTAPERFTQLPPRPQAGIRLLVVDDHPVMRDGLKQFLETQPDLEVLGLAGDGHGAVALARSLRPDVVLMDINMPGMDGLEATRILRGEQPGLVIICLSMHQDSPLTRQMLAEGCMAALGKGDPPEQLLATIRACHARARSGPEALSC